MNTNRTQNVAIEFLFQIHLSFSSFFAFSSIRLNRFRCDMFENVLYRISFSRSECSSPVRFKLPLTDRAMCSISQLELGNRYFFNVYEDYMKINEDRGFEWSTIQHLHLRCFWIITWYWNQWNRFDADTFYPWNIFFSSFCQRFSN